MANDSAVKKLTVKQTLFAEHYAEHGNGTAAAKHAGYKGNDVTLAAVGYENLNKPQIADAIGVVRGKHEKRALMDREQRLEWWERKAREAERDGDQIKAMDNLCRMHGDYTEKKQIEHTGPQILIHCTPEERRERLKKGSR